MEANINQTADFDRLVFRMNCAYGCFVMWKYIKKSFSIPEVGEQEAERRAEIMNAYGGIFTGVQYATENTFITDLHKLFDKSNSNLKLKTLVDKLPESDKKRAEILLKPLEKEIERVKELRHNFTAHDPKTPKEEQIFTEEIEKIFSVVQQVLNIASGSIGREHMTWDSWEGSNEETFTRLLEDMERGANERK
jgi:hypothetical protein